MCLCLMSYHKNKHYSHITNTTVTSQTLQSYHKHCCHHKHTTVISHTLQSYHTHYRHITNTTWFADVQAHINILPQPISQDHPWVILSLGIYFNWTVSILCVCIISVGIFQWGGFYSGLLYGAVSNVDALSLCVIMVLYVSV